MRWPPSLRPLADVEKKRPFVALKEAHFASKSGIFVAMADHEIQHVLPKVVAAVSKMEVVNPEVLRVTTAKEALHLCGRALRGTERELFHRSRKSSKISTFWSHSWHGSALKKILTLYCSYNSRPACLLGLSVGLLMALLFALEQLPGLTQVAQEPFSNWAVLSGTTTTAVVLLLWRPSHEVFVDRICISHEPTQKMEAILSLAGFMKLSDQLLGCPFRTWKSSLES